MPLLLNCGHTFCEGCLTKLARQHKSALPCPTCSHQTSLNEAGSLRQLLPNMYCLGMLSARRKLPVPILDNYVRQSSYNENNQVYSTAKQTQAAMCEECNRTQAVFCCEKCEMNMCNPCFIKVHRESSSKAMSKHKPSPLVSVNSVDESYLQCVDHPTRSIDYYCEDDQCEICSDCVIKGSHQGHKISDLQDKGEEANQQLPAAMSAASLIVRHLKHSDSVMAKSLPRLQAGAQQLASTIRQHFQLLHGKLQAREELLLVELRKLAIEDAEPIAKLRTDIGDQIHQLEKLMKGAEAAVKGKGGSVSRVILSKLQALCTSPCVAQPAGDGNSLAECSFDEQLLPLINEYGTLENKCPVSFILKSLGEVPEEFHLPPLEEDISSSPDSTTAEASLDTPSDLDSETASVTSDTSSCNGGSNRRRTHLNKQPKQMRFKSGQHLLVYVTHVRTPCSFYAVPVDNMKKIDESGIHQYAVNQCTKPPGARDTPISLNVDDLVLARYDVNGIWYRARVTNLLPEGDVELVYIDFGNPDTAHISKLLNLPSRFQHLPEMAVQCTLVGIVPAGEIGQWSAEAALTFRKIHDDKAMTMKVMGEADDMLLPVDLSKPAMSEIADDRPLSVRDTLVFLELACFTSPMSLPSVNGLPPRPVKKYLSPALPSVGFTIKACISHFNSPSSFFIHVIGEESSFLTSLMGDLQNIYGADTNDLFTVFCPTKDLVCVAQFSGDDQWYRAQVTKLPGRRCVEVHYVDFGNAEMLPHWKLKKIRDSFMVLPMQAIHCQLVDVSPVNADAGWSPDTVTYFSTFTDMAIDVTVNGIDQHGKLSVVAIKPRSSSEAAVNLNAALVSEGLALSLGPGSIQSEEPTSLSLPVTQMPLTASSAPGDALAVTVTHVESPGRFYVTLPEYQEDYNRISGRLTAVYEDRAVEEGHPWVDGDDCAVQDATKEWFRGHIKSLTDTHALLHLVDVGRTERYSINCLHPLEAEFQKPALALCCCLMDIQPAGDISRWSQTATETMCDIVMGKTCFIEPKGVSENDCLPVELLLAQEIKGDALTPDTVTYTKVAQLLKEKGVALATRPRTPRRITPTPSAAAPADSPSLQNQEWIHFPPPTAPTSETLNVVPTYVDISGIIYAQEIKEDMEKGGRLSYLLHEYSLEVISQDTYLASVGLHRVPIPRDGNCLFRALAQGICGCQNQHMEVRQAVVTALRHNPDTCVRYGVEGGDYLEKLAREGEYGGEPEIATAAEIYGVCVDVYMGGLDSSVVCNHYGDSSSRVNHVGIIYQHAGGVGDSGHYDMVVTSEPQAYSARDVYAQWRKEKAAQLLWEEPLDPACYDISLLAQLMTQLESTYKTSLAEECTWQVGQHVVARYTEDDNYYRARVTKTTPQGYEVQYIDFGNSEVVASDRIRKATVLLDIPQQCLQCQLFGIKPVSDDGSWPVKIIEFIHSRTVGETCTVYLKEKPVSGEKLQVDLVLPDNRDLGDILVLEGLAELQGNKLPPAPRTPSTTQSPPPGFLTSPDSPIMPQSPHQSPHSPQQQQPASQLTTLAALELPEPEGIMRVAVTHVIQPNIVYVQYSKVEEADTPDLLRINRQLDQLEEMNKSHGEIALALPVLSQPAVGMLCLAQFTLDNSWYRAKIIDVDNDQASVLFVDYGNAERVATQSLRELPVEYNDLPQQAYACELADMPTPSEGQSWSEDSCLHIYKLLISHQLIASVKSVCEGQLACLVLYELEAFKSHGLDAPVIYQDLIDQGLLLQQSPSSGIQE